MGKKPVPSLVPALLFRSKSAKTIIALFHRSLNLRFPMMRKSNSIVTNPPVLPVRNKKVLPFQPLFELN